MAHPPNIQHRLVEVWTWLPAFRAVAEVEHVQGAARALHVTASSLSRAIGLLEQHLGRKVFDRVGRNVKLNHDGEELLAAVREGMRRIDDGIAHVTGTVFSGELRVACEGDLPIDFVWRAATRLMKTYEGLRTTVAAASATSELAPRLLRGDLDVAFVTSAVAHPRLLVEHLGDVTYGIYCGVGHPLYARRQTTLDAIRAHAFVAPTSADDDGPGDQWPKTLERTVALRLPALQPAIAVCASGQLLALLPDVSAAQAAREHVLRRLPSEVVPPSPLFAVRRRPSGEIDRASAFVTELRAGVQEMLRKPARRVAKASSLRREPGGRPR